MTPEILTIMHVFFIILSSILTVVLIERKLVTTVKQTN